MRYGSSRTHQDFYAPKGKPKYWWLRELRSGARKIVETREVSFATTEPLCSGFPSNLIIVKIRNTRLIKKTGRVSQDGKDFNPHDWINLSCSHWAGAL